VSRSRYYWDPAATSTPGTINQNGSLEVEVGKPASDTMLSKITIRWKKRRPRRASTRGSSDLRLVLHAGHVVLGVLVAIVPPLFMGAEWLPFIYRGLVVFVVSCSCGLALSVPVAIVAAMAKAAHQGTLFKGGTYLEIVDRVKVVAFDKTGTLTIGRPEVTDVLTFGRMGEQEVLDLAGTIESRSGHPLAAAIVRKARESGVFSGQPMEEFHENAGLGVTATVRGQSCVVGSPRCHLSRHSSRRGRKGYCPPRTKQDVALVSAMASDRSCNRRLRAAGAVEALPR